MKLPPAALTAPSLCPRCDAPALYEDRCGSCGLQLGKCAACQGVAGPFDRYCGFCGHDLVVGEIRSPVWRFWLLVAMIPMIAALVIGASFYGGPAAATVGRIVFHIQPTAAPSPSPGGLRNWVSLNLKLHYSTPVDWQAFDYTKSTTTPLQAVVVTRIQADAAKYGDSKGDILATRPAGAILALGPAGIPPSGVDASDPSSMLGVDISSLTLKPPDSLKIEVLRPAITITVDGRPGKEAIFTVTRPDGSVAYLERAYILGPAGLFRIDALVPQADWTAGDDQKVEAVIRSVRLT